MTHCYWKEKVDVLNNGHMVKTKTGNLSDFDSKLF